MKKADAGVAMYLLAAIIFFIIPIPSFLLDIMLAINISLSLIILMNHIPYIIECILHAFDSEYRRPGKRCQDFWTVRRWE